MHYRQLNLSIPDETYRELKKWVPAGSLTDFVLKFTQLGLHQLRFQKAMEKSFGSWSRNPHRELSSGVDRYIRRLRRGRSLY